MDHRAGQIKRNSEILRKYIPEGSVDLIAVWILDYDFKLKIKKERSTRLGDYTSPRGGSNHLITVNFNLNKYSFLVTLVHEIAHLATFNKHKNSVLPHGFEWKKAFAELMQPFLNSEIFPIDILYALRKYMQNPGASSCSDKTLLKALKLYDENASDKIFLEYLPHKTTFLFNGERLFEKGEKMRTRFRCKEISTGQIYLFNSLTEVEVFEKINAGLNL